MTNKNQRGACRIQGADIVHGVGYRIGTSNRTLGAPTTSPEGFIVVNGSTGAVFVSTGGVWVTGGTFPSASFTQLSFDSWLLS